MPENMEIILEMKGVSAHYGGVRALHAVDITLGRGEVVALMGPNGAGKSTVLKTIFGLTAIDAGEIIWRGRPLKPVVHRMVAEGIVLVPQGRRVFGRLTVDENLEIGGFVIKDRDELRRRIDEALEFFPALKARRKARAGTLSGGGQQMLALARGLVSNPKALLLDEPSLGLSPKIIKEVFARIREINEVSKTAILVVEHNLKSLFDIVHRGYVLDKGRVVAEESSEGLRGSDILERVFMGKPLHNP